MDNHADNQIDAQQQQQPPPQPPTIEDLQAHIFQLQQALIDQRPNQFVAMSQEQLTGFINALAPPPVEPAAFNPGINRVLSNVAVDPPILVENEHFPVPPNAGDIKGAKMPDPFSGNRADVRPFLLRMNALFALQPTRYRLTKTRILTTCQLMTNSVTKTWATAVIDAVTNEIAGGYYSDNWMDFQRMILTRFGIPNEKEDAEHQIEKLTQGSLSIEQYITEFERLRIIAELSPEASLYKFKRGLRDGLYMAVASKEPKPVDLQGWMDAARQKDFLHQEIRAFRDHKGTAQTPSRQRLPPFVPSHLRTPAQRPIQRRDPDAMDVDQIQHQRRPAPPRERAPIASRPQANASRPSHTNPAPPPPQRDRPQVVCYRCGREGHYKKDCRINISELRSEEIRELAMYALDLNSEDHTRREEIFEIGAEEVRFAEDIVDGVESDAKPEEKDLIDLSGF